MCRMQGSSLNSGMREGEYWINVYLAAGGVTSRCDVSTEMLVNR